MLESFGNNAMRSTNFSAVRAAKRAVDLVLGEGAQDKNPVPYFEPTNMGGLPDVIQRREHDARLENDQGNRMRAASYLCLQSASEALAVAVDMGELAIDLSLAQRAQRLAAAAEQMRLAAALASEAAAVFAGNADPRSDGSITVSKA